MKVSSSRASEGEFGSADLAQHLEPTFWIEKVLIFPYSTGFLPINKIPPCIVHAKIKPEYLLVLLSSELVSLGFSHTSSFMPQISLLPRRITSRGSNTVVSILHFFSFEDPVPGAAGFLEGSAGWTCEAGWDSGAFKTCLKTWN